MKKDSAGSRWTAGSKTPVTDQGSNSHNLHPRTVQDVSRVSTVAVHRTIQQIRAEGQ